MPYQPSKTRYETMQYRRCGKSGVQLPLISLGLWQNFGGVNTHENSRAMVLRAFDLGITHFDLANNYGPPPGSAEETFGKILSDDLFAHRDELFISTKAGYTMWEGPYGDWGSKKYLVSSLDQSLTRMGLDYVDLYYHHRPDPNTPIEETMDALAGIVASGKALYAGISNYQAQDAARAAGTLRDMGVSLLIHQPSYSMFNRWVENGLLETAEQEGFGVIPFSPLAQGLLTNRYLGGIAPDSRAGGPSVFLSPGQVTEEKVEKARKLNDIAKERGQSLAQMALSWLLSRRAITSVIIGASRVSQIEDNVGAIENLAFSQEELDRIEAILA